MLLRIVAPHFVCGVVLRDGRVREWAHIVRYMRGWNAQRVYAYAARKGWSCTAVCE